MSNIKEKVKGYLRNDRSFMQGVVLFQSIPGHNRSLAAQFARMSDTEGSRKQVWYELAKLAGISEAEKNSLVAQRIGPAKETKKAAPDPEKKEKTKSAEPKDRFDKMKWNDIRKEAGELPEYFAPKGKTKADLLEALRTYEAHLEAQKKKAAEPQEKESSSETNSPSSEKDPAPRNSSSS